MHFTAGPPFCCSIAISSSCISIVVCTQSPGAKNSTVPVVLPDPPPPSNFSAQPWPLHHSAMSVMAVRVPAAVASRAVAATSKPVHRAAAASLQPAFRRGALRAAAAPRCAALAAQNRPGLCRCAGLLIAQAPQCCASLLMPAKSATWALQAPAAAQRRAYCACQLGRPRGVRCWQGILWSSSRSAFPLLAPLARSARQLPALLRCSPLHGWCTPAPAHLSACLPLRRCW